MKNETTKHQSFGKFIETISRNLVLIWKEISNKFNKSKIKGYFRNWQTNTLTGDESLPPKSLQPPIQSVLTKTKNHIIL